MLAQQETLQAELARKAQEERRGMLEADSTQWVRVLLTETRAMGDANWEFLSEVDSLDATRQALMHKLREQQTTINVLQVCAGTRLGPETSAPWSVSLSKRTATSKHAPTWDAYDMPRPAPPPSPPLNCDR